MSEIEDKIKAMGYSLPEPFIFLIQTGPAVWWSA